MESKGRIKGWPQPQRAVGLSNNPDPAVCECLCTVGLGPVLRFGPPGSSFAVPVLWNCRSEEWGRHEGDWQVSRAYLFSAFSWKYCLGISGENQGNRHPNCVENLQASLGEIALISVYWPCSCWTQRISVYWVSFFVAWGAFGYI